MTKGVVWHNGAVGIALVARSGSHSVFKHILKHYYPNLSQEEKNTDPTDETLWHPVKNLQDLHDLKQNDTILSQNYAVLIRDPIERFRSACARTKNSPEEALILDDVHFWTIHGMGLVTDSAKFFLFPEQLSDCLTYLGLPTSIEKLNVETEQNKPILKDKDILNINKIYYNDIVLYNNLKEKYYG